MSKQMLIDASHPEEMRVVILNQKYLEEFECETSTKKPMKGNIYLARVVRVEPSLQAAFVDFGSERHGFLAFNEIHPDYYRIPVEDQAKLLKSLSEESKAEGEEPEDTDFEETPKSRFKLKATRAYKIQEVIKKRQVILVQVVKDERGGKGAALTTYLSLPGRYCVLMPNTPRGGGISRKITDAADRKRLKEVMSSFDVMEGAGLILRTAGMGRTKLEIKRDYDYLMRLWEGVREKTIHSQAPAPIYEEGNLITKAVRDLYTKEIEEVLVEGEESYKEAKNLMRILMPSHAKKVQLYKDPRVPLFHRYGVEGKIDNIHHPVVQLPSGGYVVINPTEALVSIDVNSGKATRERHIEETALKTNLEAAEEIARQLRLRDLAGLIVIDFIDMDHSKNNTQVERAFREALKSDRARIQVGSISVFGLLEMSRQRLRPSLEETISMPCSHCRGTGIVRSIESSSLQVLRALETEGIDGRFRDVVVHLPTTVAFYILNQKRTHLWTLEKKYDLNIVVMRDDGLIQPNFRIEHVRGSERTPPETESLVTEEITGGSEQAVSEETASPTTLSEPEAAAEEAPRPSSRKRRRKRFDRHKQHAAQLTPEGEGASVEEQERTAHLKVVPSSAKTDAVPMSANTSDDNASEKASPRTGPPPARHGRRVRHAKKDSSLIALAPIEQESSAREEGEERLNKRGATRLKVGPGSARHFGRKYAKVAKETIKRGEKEETNPDSSLILPEPEQPTPLVSLPKSQGKKRARRTPQKKASPQDSSREVASDIPTLPVRETVSDIRVASQKVANRAHTESAGLADVSENPHVRVAQKKGWWKRLLDS